MGSESSACVTEECVMVSEALAEINKLFSTENEMLWCICLPSVPVPTSTPETSSPKRRQSSRTAPTPPSSSSYQTLTMSNLNKPSLTLVKSAIENMKCALLRLFTDEVQPVLHNSSYWRTFFNSLFIDLSCGLFVDPGRPLSEAEVRHELISPLLKRIAHSIPYILEPKGIEGDEPVYTSSLNVEVVTESRCHVRGAKPRVDYVFSGTRGDTTLYTIPTEVKKKIDSSHLPQMAQYLSMLVSQQPNSQCGVGIIIDEYALRIAFCPFADEMPLPVVLFTPQRKWRGGSLIDRGVCVILCMLQKLCTPLMTITKEVIEECFGKEASKTLKAERDSYVVEPLSKIQNAKFTDLFQQIEGLKQTIAHLESRMTSVEDGDSRSRKRHASSSVKK